MFASSKTTTTFASNFFGGLSIQFWLSLHRTRIKTQSSSFMSGGILSRAKLAWAYMIHAITSGNLYRRRNFRCKEGLEMHNKGNQIFHKSDYVQVIRRRRATKGNFANFDDSIIDDVESKLEEGRLKVKGNWFAYSFGAKMLRVTYWGSI